MVDLVDVALSAFTIAFNPLTIIIVLFVGVIICTCCSRKFWERRKKKSFWIETGSPLITNKGGITTGAIQNRKCGPNLNGDLGNLFSNAMIRTKILNTYYFGIPCINIMVCIV